MNTVKSVILDISGGGIRFSLSTPLEEGTYFMAQFSLALEECTQQFNIVCKVINCTQSWTMQTDILHVQSLFSTA